MFDLTCRSENLVALDDAELLARYLDGDASALGVLYARISPAVYGAILKIVHDRDEASDVLQDAWIWVIERPVLDPRKNVGGLVMFIGRRIAVSRVLDRRGDARKIEKLAAIGGPITTHYWCRYCPEEKMRAKYPRFGLCESHYQRHRRGATEEEMRKPIRRRR